MGEVVPLLSVLPHPPTMEEVRCDIREGERMGSHEEIPAFLAPSSHTLKSISLLSGSSDKNSLGPLHRHNVLSTPWPTYQKATVMFKQLINKSFSI